MIRVKDDSVQIGALQPAMYFALRVAEAVYEKYRTELVITSGNDAHHSLTSLHYAGAAVDLRTNTLPTDQHARDIAGELGRALGPDFDVIFEGDHIHLELQPRRR